MKSKGIIYIHPGLGKTATSAIQNIAFNQLKEDVLYFPFGLKGDVHNYLADVHPIFDEEHFDIELDKVAQLDKNKNYFISSEFLCYCTKEHIKSLCTKIMSLGFHIKVIFAIRELLPLIESSYLQSLKSAHGLVAGESMLGFYKRNKQQFNFNMLINKWSSVDNVDVVIIEYDKYKDNFVKVFFQYLGVEVTGSKSVTNSSINSVFIELITTIDRSIIGLEKKDRKEIIDMLIKLSDKYRGSISYTDEDIEIIEQDLSSLNKLEELKIKYEFI
ncbi:hypothetical protein [Pseudoalteromonas sp. SG45-3]|uniref:hypothetical protein n=2 Tax=unclassified Pseudoalteromonas TaxID=194690 RepID=UPI00160254B1|nr:hypothetical protein [Pseudoalteromonas sp. SG45-3]MBB1352347.1 hypothetical protein [Pseudoalteromonas sp. SG45-3]